MTPLEKLLEVLDDHIDYMLDCEVSTEDGYKAARVLQKARMQYLRETHIEKIENPEETQAYFFGH